MTEFKAERVFKRWADVTARVTKYAVVRAARSKAWGQHGSAEVTPDEEVLIATVFELAWEPKDKDGEILVALHNLEKKVSSKATLRIWLSG